MKKNNSVMTRIMSFLLCILIVFTTGPSTAIANDIFDSPDQNQELVEDEAQVTEVEQNQEEITEEAVSPESEDPSPEVIDEELSLFAPITGRRLRLKKSLRMSMLKKPPMQTKKSALKKQKKVKR